MIDDSNGLKVCRRMKRQYDSSKGVRGKFSRPGWTLDGTLQRHYRFDHGHDA